MQVKKWLNAQELADFRLKSLPNTKAGVIYRAKKDLWVARKRLERGGGQEYAFDGLPADVQAEIKAKSYKSMLPVVSTNAAGQVAVIANRSIEQLDNNQRAVADARLQLTLLVGQYAASTGSRNKALLMLEAMSRDAALPVDELTDYNAVCVQALAKTNQKVGIGYRTLQKWCIAADKCSTPTERLLALAPQKMGQPVIVATNIEWLPEFMSVYCHPNRLNIAESYVQFKRGYEDKHGTNSAPHYDAVRRALAKLPTWVRETGRLTGSAMRGLRAYVSRDWNADFMQANDIWVGDGHSLKCRVAHPQNGQAFTPEFTMIMDAHSRMIVGWSLSYSESQVAVGDALRHGMENHGVPAIYYSDNGAGQKNKTFDTDVTGVFARLGVHHATGIPGNAQGRGIIERPMKGVPKRIAQAFDTYYGKDADQETVRKRLYSLTTHNNAVVLKKSDAQMTAIQKKGRKILPSWADLVHEVITQVDDYNNNRIHSSIGTTPAKKRAQMLAVMDKDAMVMLSSDDARDLFRPSFTRTVQRGQVKWDSEFYADEALEFWSGKEVTVYIDQHDPSSVVVRELDGRFICEAMLDGFKTAAFTKSAVEKGHEKRQAARIKLKQNQIDVIRAEDRQTIEHQKSDTLNELFSGKTVKTVAAEEQEYAMFAIDLKDKQVNDK